MAGTDCSISLTASRDAVTHDYWGTTTARWSSHAAGAMVLYCLLFILLPFLGDDSWWRLPSVGIRTTEACLAASVHGLAFHGVVAPLGKQLFARSGHLRAESVSKTESSGRVEIVKPN